MSPQISKILQQAGVMVPIGTAIIALRNTGDLEARRPSAKVIWEIYERLSSANALMPATLAFSLDREGRSQAEIEELGKRSRGLVRFLPRRTYENYLLHPTAIAATLSTPHTPITADRVFDWVRQRGKDVEYLSKEYVAVEIGSG